MIASTQFSLPSIGFVPAKKSSHQDIQVMDDRTTDEFGRFVNAECRPKAQIERDR